MITKNRFNNFTTMEMKAVFTAVFILLLTLSLLTSCKPEQEKQKYDFDELPVKGMVTMLDLGAKSCIPCKMMAPILEKLEHEYRGKAAIVFIDIMDHPEQASRYNIKAMPTQIFFDQNGKEVYRHMGFMGERDITAILNRIGVE